MLQFFWRLMRRDERGFTLIELLIVVAIIAILAAILIPNFLRARKQSQISATKGNLKNLGTALESYFVDWNAYPATLSLLAGGSPVYLRAVPTTPVNTQYVFDLGAVDQDYAVCDDDTDQGTGAYPDKIWYYTPGGGLSGPSGSDCTAAAIP